MKKIKVLFLVIIYLFLIESITCFAFSNSNDLSSNDSSVADSSALKIHQYRLKNGLTLIIGENHRAPVVFSSIWYKVGSSYEQNGMTGISHALEHMMFRGTQQYGAGQFVKLINENGGLQNAMTTQDYTLYYQYLPADKLEVSFKLEADRMRHLLLNEQDFLKEIQVVMEERRMNFEDNPQSMTYVLLNTVAATNSPDQHPTIGWKSDLQQMTVSDLRQWYQTWYAPNNAVIVVFGDVNPKRVYELAQHYFAALPEVRLPIRKKFISEPDVSTRKITVSLPAKLPLLMMAYHVPSVVTVNPKLVWQPYALLLLSNLLGESDSSRLVQDLVRKHQNATEVSVDYNPFRLVDTLFTIIAVPAPAYTSEQLSQAILSEIKQLQQKPVSVVELNRAKAQFIAQYVYDKDSLMNQAMEIGVSQMIGWSWQQMLEIVNKIQVITPQQVQQVAQTFLQPNRLTIADLQPQSADTHVQQPTGDSHVNVLH